MVSLENLGDADGVVAKAGDRTLMTPDGCGSFTIV